jgi:hypothetical protein
MERAGARPHSQGTVHCRDNVGVVIMLQLVDFSYWGLLGYALVEYAPEHPFLWGVIATIFVSGRLSRLTTRRDGGGKQPRHATGTLAPGEHLIAEVPLRYRVERESPCGRTGARL